MRAFNFRGLNIVVLFNLVSRMRAFNFHGLNIVVLFNKVSLLRESLYREVSQYKYNYRLRMCVCIHDCKDNTFWDLHMYISFGRTVEKHYSYLTNVYSYNLQLFFTLLIVVYDQ